MLVRKFFLSRQLRPLGATLIRFLLSFNRGCGVGNKEGQANYSLTQLVSAVDGIENRFGAPAVYIGRTAVGLDRPLGTGTNYLSAPRNLFIVNTYCKNRGRTLFDEFVERGRCEYLDPTSVGILSPCGMLNNGKEVVYGRAVFLRSHSGAGSILVFPGCGPGRRRCSGDDTNG